MIADESLTAGFPSDALSSVFQYLASALSLSAVTQKPSFASGFSVQPPVLSSPVAEDMFTHKSAVATIEARAIVERILIIIVDIPVSDNPVFIGGVNGW